MTDLHVFISQWVAARVTAFVYSLVATFTAADSRTGAAYLLGAAALAAGCWWCVGRSGSGLLGFLFPRAVWGHRSAWLDCRLLLVRLMFGSLRFGGGLLPAVAVATWTARLLWHHVAILPTVALDRGLVTGLFSVAAFTAEDLARYGMHRAMHRVPALWELHKLHHSAEVLTPLTVYRTHPVEGALMTGGAALAVGLTAGVTMWLFPGGLTAWELSGVYALQYLWNAAGANLRHSHIWLSYGPRVERYLVSPAQHQLHHSADPRHHGCNYGAALALWDRCFGTLQLAGGRRVLRFGLPPEERNHGNGVCSALLRPLQAGLSLVLPVRRGGGMAEAGSRWLHALPWLAVVWVAAPVLAQAGEASAQVKAEDPEQVAEEPEASDGEPAFGATATVTSVPRAPGSAHVIGSGLLERLEYDDPHAVLSAVPGVVVRGEDGMGLRPNIGLRGNNPDRSKKLTLMEDGVLLGPAPYSAPAAYYTPILTRMDALRVTKGPASVRYGPQTVGGALDMITPGIPGGDSATLDLAGGSYAYRKAHGRVGGSGERLSFLLEGVHLGTDGFKRLPGGGDTGFTRNEWMLKTGYWHPPSEQQLQLKLTYSDEVSNETYLGITEADFRQDPLQRYAASALDRMENHRTSLVLTHRAQPAQWLGVVTDVYRHNYRRVWRKLNQLRGAGLFGVLTAPEDPRNALFVAVLRGEVDGQGGQEALLIGPNDRRFVSQGVQTRADLGGRTGPLHHSAQLGLRLHYDRIERRHSDDAFVVSGGELFPEGTPTRTMARNQASTLALAGYVSDSVSLGALTVTPGVRVERIQSGLDDPLNDGSKRATRWAVLPGFGLHYWLVQDLGLLAGVHRGFSPAPPGSQQRPESSVNYEAGMRYGRRGTRVELIGFRSDYGNLTNICTFSSGCGGDELDSQTDAGRARTQGIEASANHTLRAGAVRFPLGLAYTYARSEFLSDFSSSDPVFGEVRRGDAVPYVPRQQLSTHLAAQMYDFGVDLRTRYVSRMREAPGRGSLDDGLTTDAQYLLDLALRYDLGAALQVYVDVQNLLDSRYLVGRRPFGARPNAPRWFHLGIKLRR